MLKLEWAPNTVYRDAVRFVWLLLIPLGILTFHNLSGAGFVGDDYDQVVHNESIRTLDPTALLTGSTFFAGGGKQMGGTYYRPVMMAAFSLIYHFWETSAYHFHVLLVGIAILNSILAFFFFRSLFTPLVSLVGSAAFLLHPLNSEVVAYISDYQDALFMLFGLIAINIEAHRKSAHAGWFVAEFLFLMLSGLSKETGFLFLPILVLFNVLVRGHDQPQGATKRLWQTVAAVVLAYSSVRILVSNINVVQSHHAPMELAPFAMRLLNMPAVVAYYLKNFFFPWPLGIAQHWIYREITLEGFFFPLLGIAAFLIFAFFTVRRFGVAAMFFLIWWAIGLGLHIHVIPLDSTVADRWHYLPSLSLIGLFLFWLEDSLVRPPVRYYAGGLAILFIVVFGLLTHRRNEDWANEEKLLSRDLRYQPGSFAIMSQLGFIYLDQKRYPEACGLLEKSVAIAPNWSVNTNNLGVCYFNTGRFAEAEAHFRKSIENGRYHLAYVNLANMLILQKRYAEAKEFIEMALRVFPYNPVLPRMLASVRKASN